MTLFVRSKSAGTAFAVMTALTVISACGSPPHAERRVAAADVEDGTMSLWRAGDYGDSASTTADGVDCPGGFAAFQNTIFPLMRDHCATCHAPNANPAADGPFFAVENPASSYASVLRYQDFDQIATSYFVTKGGTMTPDTTRADLQQAVEAWWTGGENACPRKGRIFSESLPLPATLPGRDQGFVKMRWALSSAATPALQGVVFEMEAQNFQNSSDSFKGAYRFRKPRLLTPDHALQVKDVKVLVNGAFRPFEDAYRAIGQTVAARTFTPDPATASGAPVLAPDALLVGHAHQGSDEIMVSFETLGLASATPACAALTAFTSQVVPALAARNCHACHGGGPADSFGLEPARSVFNMSQAPAPLCAEFLQRLRFDNLYVSPLVSYPFTGKFGHPVALTSEEDVEAAFRAWYAGEAPLRGEGSAGNDDFDQKY